MAKSIYTAIQDALNGGCRLPKDFDLSSGEKAPNQIQWAAGAKDGAAIFHMGILYLI